MCVIVDANLAAVVFGPSCPSDYVPLRNALLDNRARLPIGGRLRLEYSRIGAAMEFLRVLDEAGVSVRYNDDAVDSATTAVTKTYLCASDDPHIIALARLSGSRILCTNDQKLIRDFKNRALISPKGRIYSNSRHGSWFRLPLSCRAAES